MSVTDEMIAAYADGELEGAAKTQVEAALAADPALTRKLDAHRALKARLAAHYAPIAEQAVPSHLAAMLAKDPRVRGGGEVVSMAAKRQKWRSARMLRRWGPIAGPALAASLVLALWQPWQGGTPEGYAGERLAATLDTQLVATQPRDADTRILLSFAREGGGLCRAWRDADSGGIACRNETGWKIERQFALEAITSGGAFRQAGSEADLLAVAQDMAAGEALDAEAERAARSRDWQK